MLDSLEELLRRLLPHEFQLRRSVTAREAECPGESTEVRTSRVAHWKRRERTPRMENEVSHQGFVRVQERMAVDAAGAC